MDVVAIRPSANPRQLLGGAVDWWASGVHVLGRLEGAVTGTGLYHGGMGWASRAGRLVDGLVHGWAVGSTELVGFRRVGWVAQRLGVGSALVGGAKRGLGHGVR